MTTTLTIASIDDVLNLINEMAKSENEELRKHAETLQGPRTRGSTTKVGLDALRGSSVPFQQQEADGGAIAYIFTLTAPQRDLLDPRVGAIRLDEAIGGHDIRIRQGDHGPELVVACGRALEDLPRTDELTVIVGDFGGSPAVFTWHPGLPLRAFDGEQFSEDTAVKLHHG